jgi:hypothetical protein
MFRRCISGVVPVSGDVVVQRGDVEVVVVSDEEEVKAPHGAGASEAQDEETDGGEGGGTSDEEDEEADGYVLQGRCASDEEDQETDGDEVLGGDASEEEVRGGGKKRSRETVQDPRGRKVRKPIAPWSTPLVPTGLSTCFGCHELIEKPIATCSEHIGCGVCVRRLVASNESSTIKTGPESLPVVCTHHGSQKCPFCRANASITDLETLVRGGKHLREFYPGKNEDSRHACPLDGCLETYMTFKEWQLHMLTCFRGGKEFKCKFCVFRGNPAAMSDHLTNDCEKITCHFDLHTTCLFSGTYKQLEKHVALHKTITKVLPELQEHLSSLDAKVLHREWSTAYAETLVSRAEQMVQLSLQLLDGANAAARLSL